MAIENIGLYQITIDVYKKHKETTVQANDNDSNGRGLLITLVKDGVPFNSSGINLKIGFRNAVGEERLYDCDTVNASEGKYKVFYPTEMLQGNGGRVVKLEIKAFEASGALLNYAPVFVYVSASEIPNDSIGGGNELSTLVNALSQVQGIDNRFGEVNAQLAESTQRAKNAQVDLVVDFGGSTTKEDNHDSIIAALNYLNSNGGGTLLVPIGVFKTSPLILNNFRNIIIKGVSPSMPWKTTSCFKLIGSGEVGIQLSEVSGIGYVNEVPTWNSTEVVIENMRIDCDKKVNTGINGNYGITLRNVTVDYALRDGIVFEPQTYPFILDRVFVRYSGRHGLYVKAPYTTVYNLYDCEFQYNDGYGIYIEDGSTSLLQNVLLQFNKQGGLKIEKKNSNLYTKQVFLGRLLFINVYTENNGSLLETDPNYDGNCALKILSYDKVKHINVNKIHDLSFINCSFNFPPATGKMAEISGIANIHMLGTAIPNSAINFNESGTVFATTNGLSVINNENDTDYTVREFPYYNQTTKVRSFVGHGYIGKRGRMRELHYYLSAADITAGQTVTMKTLSPLPNINYYPILQEGSVYGINIHKRSKPTSGKLTFKVKRGFKIYGALDNQYLLLPELSLDNTKNNVSLNFPLLDHLVSNELILGIEVTASADYVAGPASHSDLICELFIES